MNGVREVAKSRVSQTTRAVALFNTTKSESKRCKPIDTLSTPRHAEQLSINVALNLSPSRLGANLSAVTKTVKNEKKVQGTTYLLSENTD